MTAPNFRNQPKLRMVRLADEEEDDGVVMTTTNKDDDGGD
jgi:hypothetical protein